MEIEQKKMHNPNFSKLNHKDGLSELKKFAENIPIKAIIKGMSLYLDVKNSVSQDKLREAGFKIVREPMMADVIIVSDNPFKISTKKGWISCDDWSDQIVSDYEADYEFAFVKHINPFIYKNKASTAWFEQLDNLLKSGSRENVTLAMEFMTNTDWSDNQIQLAKLFYNYWHGTMISNKYRSSVSFKGFLNSLSFNYKRVFLEHPMDYTEFCTKDEDHQWVFDSNNDKFQDALKELSAKYKINIKNIDYELIKTISRDDHNNIASNNREKYGYHGY